jgi:hypothetical protein
MKTATKSPLAWVVLATSSALISSAIPTLAQDPIRVETNEVLVPATVYDVKLSRALRKDPKELFAAILAGDVKRAYEISESVLVRGLSEADFRVFEDGKPVPVRSVSYEQSPHWDFQDSQYFHSEGVGLGEGKWSTREWSPGQVASIGDPHYVVAYSPPDSPEGSCHEVKIEVNRPKVAVVARGDYCNTKHLSSDPLKGTSLGNQLERELASATNRSFGITAAAASLFADGNTTRVHIAVDWSWKSLAHHLTVMGVLELVYKRDGTLVARFSDGFGEVGETRRSLKEQHLPRDLFEDHIIRDVFPVRYETQLFLSPGEYELQIALSDGKKFARTKLPLVVDDLGRKALAISAVSLGKQVQKASGYSEQTPSKLMGTWAVKMPGKFKPLVSNGLEFKVSGDTRFKKNQILYTYFEVFEPLLEAGSATAVTIQERVVDLKTGESVSDPGFISATPYAKPGSALIPIGRGMHISNLPDGSYRLDVRAVDSAGKQTDWRSANFTVE